MVPRPHGVTIRRVLTDNAKAYRGTAMVRRLLSALQIKRRYIQPGRPWTNGKAERFNRTLHTEWAYSQSTWTQQRRHGPQRLLPGSPTTTLNEHHLTLAERAGSSVGACG